MICINRLCGGFIMLILDIIITILLLINLILIRNYKKRAELAFKLNIVILILIIINLISIILNIY